MGFVCLFLSGDGLGKTAGKGDIVLFNNPNPRFPQTSVGNREVFISRVVGIPGDTLMLNDELWVTDEQVLSPDSKSLYVLFSYGRRNDAGCHAASEHSGKQVSGICRGEVYTYLQSL